MAEKLFQCKCGCTQFLTITPHQYQDEDVNKWGSFGQRIYGVAPVLICLHCNHITIPPISMSGKSRLDPNVQAFGDLMHWVEEHNKPKPEHVCKCSSPVVTIGYSQIAEEVGKPCFNQPEEEEEYMSKLDKQTIPSKDTFDHSPAAKPKSQEPRNKTKTKAPTKPRVRNKKNKTNNTTSKDDTNI